MFSYEHKMRFANFSRWWVDRMHPQPYKHTHSHSHTPCVCCIENPYFIGISCFQWQKYRNGSLWKVYKSMGWKTARFSLSLHSHTRLVFFANVCHTFIETYSFYCATESFSHGKFIIFVQTRLKCKGLHTGFDARRGRLLCLKTSYQLHSTRPEL